MIKECIADLVEKKDLKQAQVTQTFEEIMRLDATPAQISAFLIALRIKGETADELTGAALVLRKFVKRINTGLGVVLDTCGTGADRQHTFNISTVCAFVAAGAGVVVAKHGNRAITSSCGSADLLEALGVNINLNEEKVEECIKKIGIGFLFAPLLHPAMKNVRDIRAELGVRTIFNLLGPLANPAFATHQLLGVYDLKLLKPIAQVLKNLGLKHALVVHGLDGLDEVTSCTDTAVCELKNGRIRNYKISPGDFKIKKARLKDLRADNVEGSIEITLEVLQGKKGVARDIVLLNAGCAIYAADKAKTIRQGIELARKSIDSGAALSKLEELKKYSNT